MLGCKAGKIACTPVVDGLAKAGISHGRAHCQSVVCMATGATMITGQYVRSHDVLMSGIHLCGLYRDGFQVTLYEKSALYDGRRSEPYDLKNEPLQWRNLWSDPAYARLESDLLGDIRDNLPPPRDPPLIRYSTV